MVCSLGSGRMAAMARVLVAGLASHAIADEVGHQKLVSQYILRELRDADELNLIDEEDMHIFDLKPMTDPLNLVRCNACKKPVKASQYATHSVLCKSLSPAQETVPQLDGGTGRKKPPRKERRKVQIPCAPRSVVEQERFQAMGSTNIAASASHLDEKIGTITSFTTEAKGGEYRKESSPGGGFDHNTGFQSEMPGKIHDRCLLAKDLPVPLATKIYYSQRNHRMRSSINLLYREMSTEEQGSDLHNPVILQGNVIPPQISSPQNFPLATHDAHQEKGDGNCILSVQKPDQNPAQSSEIYSSDSREGPTAINFTNHLCVNNVSRHHAAPIGMTRSNCSSNSYTFPGNSGMMIGSMQQPKVSCHTRANEEFFGRQR